MDKPRVKGSLLTLSGSIPLAGLPEQERDDLLPRAQALKEQLVASQTLHAFMAALGARLPASELRAILQTQCGVADPPPLGFLLRLQTAFNNQVTVFNDPAGVEDTMQICGRGIILTDSKKFPGPVPHFPADGKVVTIHWVSTPNFLPKELATIKVGMKVWEHAMEGRLVFKEVNYKAVEETAPLDKVLADCSADAAYKKNLLEKLDKFIAEENAFSAVRKELKEEQNQKFLDAKEKRNTAMKALNKILMEEFRKGTLQSNPRNLLVLSSVEYLREPPMTKKGSTCTVTAQSTPGVEPFIVMLEQRFIFALAHMELLPKLITRDKFLRTVVHELGHILGLCHNFNHPRSVHVFTDFALVEMTRFLCYKSIDTGSVMAYDYVRLTESAKKVLGNKLELVGTQASPSMQDIQDVMEIYFPGETCDPPRNVLSLKDIELPQDYNPRAEQRKLRAGNELVLNISDLTKLIDSQEKFTKIAKGAMSFLEQVNKKNRHHTKKKDGRSTFGGPAEAQESPAG
mmetsp:Transcript_25821/g.64853  ORF Transcript_25821/g.64853 Transcript_25821/m.64853 type:complete len:515 (+) Transcript_25821:70-1614(+)